MGLVAGDAGFLQRRCRTLVVKWRENSYRIPSSLSATGHNDDVVAFCDRGRSVRICKQGEQRRPAGLDHDTLPNLRRRDGERCSRRPSLLILLQRCCNEGDAVITPRRLKRDGAGRTPEELLQLFGLASSPLQQELSRQRRISAQLEPVPPLVEGLGVAGSMAESLRYPVMNERRGL